MTPTVNLRFVAWLSARLHACAGIATLAAAAGSVVLWSPAAVAQTFPTQPVRIVVPFPAGGGSDIMARRIGEQLREELGQPVVVDNRAGASGNIGAAHVARSDPDGHTLLLTAAPFAIAPAMFKDLPFHPVKDFAAVTQIAIVPLLVVTRPESPLNSMADLVALAKAQGDKVNFASFGNGSPPHLVGESIKLLTNIKMTHVPYKGGMAAMPDILSGQIDVAILDAVSITPLVKSGQLKALAITGPRRSHALPEVPTLTESDIAFDTVGWHALFAPVGVPTAVLERLNAAVNKVLTQPAMRDFIIQGGSIPVDPPTSLSAWGKQFETDVSVWDDVARKSGARVE